MKSLVHAPTRAEIDLDALAFNLDQVRSLVGNSKKILAVVKANAYGHGAVGIARELEALGVDFLGVAFLEEGITLRKTGIKLPILILGGIFQSQVKDVFKYNLTPVIFDLALARALEDEGKRVKKEFPFHIKIDTGMNRLGVPYDQAEGFFDCLRSFRYLKIEGILSHFSSAHLKDKESIEFTAEQEKKFKNIITLVKKFNFSTPLIHIANSSAIIEGLMPELTMVRAGLMLYGAYPSDDSMNSILLKPVMALTTRIIQIKSLPSGTPISYSRTFSTKRESLIATLAVGYADGFRRCLSNQAKVLIKGQEANIVGSVCMDLTMADISDLTGVQKEDEVVLFGCQGDARISVEQVANWAGTIPYEILCGISNRVPRIFKKGGIVVKPAKY